MSIPAPLAKRRPSKEKKPGSSSQPGQNLSCNPDIPSVSTSSPDFHNQLIS